MIKLNSKSMIRILSLLFSIGFILSCHPDSPKYILDENYNENTLGWIEEHTEKHHVELMEGTYYIHSLDSSMRQTSVNSLNDDYLCNLGSQYEIFTEMEYVKGTDESGFGFLLVCASLQYRFVLKSSGLVEIREHEGDNDYESIIVSDTTSIDEFIPGSKHLFYLVITGYNFEFYVDNNLIIEDAFRAKSWKDIRLLSERLTAIKVDYLRIR
jgi:hypothetical protein